jgi:hypothetical protein
MKSLLGLGKTEVQDALQRLDMLTREECGMVAARHLEVTHDVATNVQALDRSVKVVEQVTCGVGDDVKIIKDGAQKSLIFMHMSTQTYSCANQRWTS